MNEEKGAAGHEEPALPCTIDEVRGLAAMPVYSTTGPSLCGLFGCGRSVGYSAVKRGQWPSARLGRRVVVPVPKLLVQLGVTAKNTEAA